MKPLFAVILLLATAASEAAFFLDSNGLMLWLPDFEAYQEKREIRYMAKSSQYVGYVTGIVDAMDGTGFCLPGAVSAESAAGVVAAYLREHPQNLPRKAADAVAAALGSRYPCRQ